MSVPLTILILTLNEEVNLPACLQSVVGWAADVLVLDSGSTDRTVALAEAGGAKVFHRPFDTYAAQRTYAVRQLPIQTEWVLFLDADEYIDAQLKAEIESTLVRPDAYSGYFINLKFMFMDRWIRHGGYDKCSKLVLFQRSKLVGIERDMDELVIVSGTVGTLQHPIIHQDKKTVYFWYTKHARYTRFQVDDLLKAADQKSLRWADCHNRRDRKRWVKEQVWGHIPALLRPFLYFGYRYFFQLGILDGKEGFVYHFSHAFLYQFMIAVVYLDERDRQRKNLLTIVATPA
ncbi:glycosyltransferase family 2 protein [Fibrella arboris]|uniref:glycosyltransferase family 2 protein n=1 Tax=Fibrella arboris TaxID=3242486 RepID=UPI00351F9595